MLIPVGNFISALTVAAAEEDPPLVVPVPDEALEAALEVALVVAAALALADDVLDLLELPQAAIPPATKTAQAQPTTRCQNMLLISLVSLRMPWTRKPTLV
jgi:hypothetical protein